MTSENSSLFAVVAEKADYPRNPLLMWDQSFDRLLADVVIPYENNEAFWIDGVPVERKSVQRLKILIESPQFGKKIEGLHQTISDSSGHPSRQQDRAIAIKEYPMRIEGMIRSDAQDVTPQVIRAYKIIQSEATAPSDLKKALIQQAWGGFVQLAVAAGIAGFKHSIGSPSDG